MAIKGIVPVTGEIEFHNCPWRLERNASVLTVATRKLDGFSMSAGNVPSGFMLTNRTKVAEADSVFAGYAESVDLAPRLRHFPDLIFQGELTGPGIRQNRMNQSRLEWSVFNVLKVGVGFLDFHAAVNACKAAELEFVPVLSVSKFSTVDDLLAVAAGGPDKEGAVFRPLHETSDAAGRVSYKVFNPAYAHQ